MTEHRSPIPARVYNAAVGGHVCGPEDVDFGQKIFHLVKYDRFGNEVSFESQVTQTNKIYVIHDDFILSSNITIPANCVLKFEGGSISGAYTVTGNNTCIDAELVKIFNTNITLAGTWNVTESYPEWFGAKGDGVTDDSTAVGKAINISSIVIFDGRKEYLFGYIHVTSNTVLQCNSAKFIHAPINENQPDFIWVTNAKLIIKDAIIDGNPSFYVNKQREYYLLHANTKGSLEVYNCHFKNIYGHVCSLGNTWVGTNISDYAWDCKVINCKFDLYTDIAVGGDAINSTKCNGIIVEGNTINGGFSGIRLQLYCKNIKVCNNIIKNINRDVAITIAHSEDSIVDNNICCGCYSNGIEIRGVVTCKVTNNKVYDNGACGIALAQYTIGETSDSNYYGTVSDKYPNAPGNYQNGDGTEMPCIEVDVEHNMFYNNAAPSYFYKSMVTVNNNLFAEPKPTTDNPSYQVIITPVNNEYNKFVFTNNTFFCDQTNIAAIYGFNKEDESKCFGCGNKLFNSRLLSNNMIIIGENRIYDIYDDPDYLFTTSPIELSTNKNLYKFVGLNATIYIMHIVVKSVQGNGQFLPVINAYTAEGTYKKTLTETTVNVSEEYQEYNIFINATTIIPTDQILYEAHLVDNKAVIIKECYISTIAPVKAKVLDTIV